MKLKTTLWICVVLAVVACLLSDLFAETYLCSTAGSGHKGIGNILHWEDPNADVDWYISTQSMPYYMDEEEAIDEVDASYDNWQDVTTADITFTYQGETYREYDNDGYNIFCWTYVRDDGAYEEFGFDEDLLGCASITYNGSDEIVDVDIILNGEDIDWSTDGTPSGSERDLRAVATHEIGHLCGLGHSFTTGATMEQGYQFDARTLEVDDEIGISYLYRGTVYDDGWFYDDYFDWPITLTNGADFDFEDTIMFRNGSSITVEAGSELTITGWGESSRAVIDFVTGSSGTGIYIEEGGSAEITWANIKNAHYGICADDPSLLDVRNSKIFDCSYGIYVSDCDTDPNIISNEIYDNYHGCHFYNSDGTVSYNDIENNDQKGVICMIGRSPTFRNNSIASNGSHEMYVPVACTNSVDAENNWWGTDAPDDDSTNLFYGDIDYDPWLMSEP